jgi:osmotically-inducible protein OsmY
LGDSVRSTTCRRDQDIQANVSEELQDISGIHTHIAVTVNGGVVTLSGDINSLPERLAAKRAAMRVPGVTALADELQIHVSGTSATTDADIARAASQLLGCAADVPSDTVRVEVRHHVVTLSGSVTRDYQRVAAARAVTSIDGVTGVTNAIVLHGTGTASAANADQSPAPRLPHHDG